ncbi:MAG: hypothetical protein ACFE8V_11175 [Promethearchaeota archaeon]
MVFERNRDILIIVCVFSIIAFVIFFISPIIMGMFLWFARFWYISFPIFVSILVLLKVIYSRMSKNTAYKAFNNLSTQKKFNELTGTSPLTDGKPTKAYRKWLLKDISNLKSIAKEDSLNEVIILVIGLVIFILLGFTIASYLGFYFRF